jgi:hypothetical protein
MFCVCLIGLENQTTPFCSSGCIMSVLVIVVHIFVDPLLPNDLLGKGHWATSLVVKILMSKD